MARIPEDEGREPPPRREVVERHEIVERDVPAERDVAPERTEVHHHAAPSSRGWLWVLPLVVLAAVLAWYALTRGQPTAPRIDTPRVEVPVVESPAPTQRVEVEVREGSAGPTPPPPPGTQPEGGT
jgi:hypothetical protein